MEATIALLQRHNELETIDTPLDIYLEIPQLAYIEAKRANGGKALLFTKPMRGEQPCAMPVLMNVFGSFKRVELIATKTPEAIATRIKNLLNLAQPKGLKGLLNALRRYSVLRFAIPKYVSKSSAQEVRYLGKEVDLYKLPILTTWESDSAPFITMGQVYTQSLDGSKKNLGLYRLQVHSRNELGLHWQIHKDSTHFFHEYKRAGEKMPVTIALGGDPLYTWCAQAPLPHGAYELMLYGVIKDKRVEVVCSLTNPLSVPSGVDIIIEGYVDTTRLKDEGPFGDHTGFYTPIEPYPVLEITAITHKSKPIYPATIVGKPPLEDKYMGYLTERVFLPLLQTSAHGLLDYNMPENGVFHNLILAKLAPQYPGHARQLMHAFWGVGQMSFVKHAIFVGEDAPDLSDYPAVLKYVLDRFSVKGLVVSEGVCDALDHASPEYAYGGKLGLDVAEKELVEQMRVVSDCELLARLKECIRGRVGFLAKNGDCGGEPAVITTQGNSLDSPCKAPFLAQKSCREQIGLQTIQDCASGTTIPRVLEEEKWAKNENADSGVEIVRQYGAGARVRVAIVGLNSMGHKAEGAITLESFARACSGVSEMMKIAILVDSWKNDLDNPYMLVWRIVNNIDARRDVLIQGEQVFIDARDKPQSPAHPRAWPKETDCSKEVIDRLKQKGFSIDEQLLHRFHICGSPATR